MKYYCQKDGDSQPNCPTWDDCHQRGTCLAKPFWTAKPLPQKGTTRSEILSEVMSAITEARPCRTGPYDDFGSGVEKGFDDCWELVLKMLEGKNVED